jgi:integrase
MENVRIEDWLSQTCESPKTRRHYIFVWNHFTEFCKSRGKDSSTLVDDWRAAKRLGEPQRETFLEEWQDIIRAFNTWLKTKFAPITVKNHLVGIRSFVKYWKIPLDVDLPKHSYVVYHNRDLKQEELKNILKYASTRDRVIWLVMAESGMRSDNAVNLKYAQIKEDFEASRVPMKIMLHSSVLKDHVGDRWTFIGDDAFRELKAYLQGKKLEDDDYVFASERPAGCKGEQFGQASLSVKFNKLVQKLGIDKSLGNREKVGRPKPKQIRLHGLRKYFYNNLKSDSDYRKFWMGHSLGVDAHYISRDVEEHRKKYAEGYRTLRIFESLDLSNFTELLSIKDREIKELKEKIAAKDQEHESRIGALEEKFDSIIMKYALEKAHVEYNKQYQIEEKKEE